MSGTGLIHILGAASTGKTTLAHALLESLLAAGRSVCLLPDTSQELRRDAALSASANAWLAKVEHEQARLAQARHEFDLVLLDGGPLWLKCLASQLAWAPQLSPLSRVEGMAGQGGQDIEEGRVAGVRQLYLLGSMDLTWGPGRPNWLEVADNEALDDWLRSHLQGATQPYVVVAGSGEARTNMACAAIDHWLQASTRASAPRQGWKWVCQDCGDGDCEQHWLTRAMSRSAHAGREGGEA